MILPEEMENVVLLSNLAEAQLRQLTVIAQLRECPADTVLFSEGENSPYFYFLLSGHVGLDVQEPEVGPVQVFSAGPGDLIGWSPILGRPVMTATARTTTRCRLAALGMAQVASLCERDPCFAAAFLRQTALVLSDRLRGARRALARALAHRPQLATTPEGSD
jgi:CRP-like cAMP-binding protein